MASERFQRRIERLLDEADDAISQFDWEKVRQCAQAVLAIDPGNADGLEFLATVERALSASSAPPPAGQLESPTPNTTPAVMPVQPTSFANGRCQVKRFLGEGGKKKVYLAHNTTLDREVAFALIKTEGLDETSRIRIQWEAQAMGRLGSHPHIVTVFDLGEEQNQPYMVTELMGGGDIEGVIENAGDHRLPLEQAIKIAQETCRGMEFAHSRGIVHRDLKPGNVWLTSDGIAKIGDFGLAVALDRSRLTTEGMMVGTVSYMPPEQAMGNLDQAAAHFEDALSFCRNSGYRPELAWTLCDYADMLLERNADGDSAKVTSLLDESLSISSDLGMRPLMERVLSRREILKA